jgi:hypothetical protein
VVEINTSAGALVSSPGLYWRGLATGFFAIRVEYFVRLLGFLRAIKEMTTEALESPCRC